MGFGEKIAGHLVGSVPHERTPNDKITLYMTSGSNEPMSRLSASGPKRHWILEIHLVNGAREVTSPSCSRTTRSSGTFCRDSANESEFEGIICATGASPGTKLTIS
jgi:hypothetical protein